MSGRIGKILLALWWLAWTCIIVPGHTRGVIALDGTLARGADGKSVAFLFSSLPSCCRPKSPAGSHGDKSAPSADHCAICMIVANTGLTAEVPPILDSPRLVSHAFVPQAAQLASSQPRLTYQGRAPPCG